MQAGGRGPERGLCLPTGLARAGDLLLVADGWNHRVLGFDAALAADDPAPVLGLGQKGFGDVEPNRGGDPDGVDIRPQNARPGDVVIVRGDIGVHGVAILFVREGIGFGPDVRSDSAPLNGLVAAMLAVVPDVHVLRDPTRGGLAATLHEISAASGLGVEVVERSVPVPTEVAHACGCLGLDPRYVANEGKVVAFVPRELADAVLVAMRHPGRRPAPRGAAAPDLLTAGP